MDGLFGDNLGTIEDIFNLGGGSVLLLGKEGVLEGVEEFILFVIGSVCGIFRYDRVVL